MTNDEAKCGGKSCGGCQGIFWWATLVMAVLAVPAFAAIVSTVLPVTGMVKVAVFMIACWVSTYLGMKLMQKPSMSRMIGKKEEE